MKTVEAPARAVPPGMLQEERRVEERSLQESSVIAPVHSMKRPTRIQAPPTQPLDLPEPPVRMAFAVAGGRSPVGSQPVARILRG